MPLLPSALPPKGEARRYVANDFLNLIALPSWGRGDRAAVDRVLPYIVDLRRISPLIFHTASTLSGSLRSPPSPRGEGFVRRYCFSTYAYIRSDNARKAAFSYRKPSPLGKGDRAAVDRVLSFIAYLRRSPPLIFHPARTLSGSLCSPPSPRGEGCVRRYCFSTYACICTDNARKAAFSFRCLHHAVKAVLSLCHHPQPALPLRGQAKEAQGASCASLIVMHFPAEIRYIHCLMSFRIATEGKTALPEVFLFADIAFDRPAIEESTDIEE